MFVLNHYWFTYEYKRLYNEVNEKEGEALMCLTDTTIVSKPEEKLCEENLITTALQRCGHHPKWSLKPRPKSSKEPTRTYGTVTIPYIPSLSEKIARSFRKHNIKTVHKPSRTIKSILCSKSKDPIHDMDKTGVIYHVNCSAHNTDYIGETSRALKARAHEHGLVPHKEAHASFSYNQPPTLPPQQQPEHQNVRRSQ